jgi:hypothetical protein
MHQLRTIVRNERRELITLGFAVLVFLVTLFASYLHDPELTGNQSGDTVSQFMSQRSRHDAAKPVRQPDRWFIG